MDGNAKQEAAEKLRSSSSVLVTVSKDPSVDQLASALGLSLMLTKLGKHTTAVFSGKTPNTMEFLEPENTFDTTVDGLRDFIISLDKDKADKLRYKVEDNVVKIFITPYKSKLTEDDLVFSEGDFNVDLVVALGVHQREDLDNAITSHGRILHDATIVTINAGSSEAGKLGAINWNDSSASSLSEMLVSISEALENGILDKQMSTAFLTGIVAATDRFKNNKTTPKIMTMAAQLMAGGANQQLIAKNLQVSASDNIPEKVKTEAEIEPPKAKNDNEPKEIDLEKLGEGIDHNVVRMNGPPDKQPNNDRPKDTVELDRGDSLIDIENSVKAKHNKLNDEGRTERVDSEDEAIKKLEEDLSHDSSSNLIDLEDQFKSYEKPAPEPKKEQQAKRSPLFEIRAMDSSVAMPDDRPTMGGTFNATASEAHDQMEIDRNKAVNKEILTHGVLNHDGKPTARAKDIPESNDLMKDLADARREVEQAMNASDFNSSFNPTSALNASPMPMDEEDGGNLNIQTQQGLQPPPANINQGPVAMQAQQQMPQSQNYNYPQTPAQQMNNLQNPMYQQQPPVNQNPMYNNMPQQQYPQNGNSQQLPPTPNGNNQQLPPPQNGNGQLPPPPLPPVSPPPMPPFN